MTPGPSFIKPSAWRRNLKRLVFLVLLAQAALPLSSRAALPRRLVIALDGVSYPDMKALQEGVTYTDRNGRPVHRQAFHRGYFPVSRMISTFPSASDVAWTEILGDRPLPGYQRTYFCEAANQEVFQNGVTTTMEYERQMSWQENGGLLRTLGFILPTATFSHEAHGLVKNFLKADNRGETFYALLRSPDDAQHLAADILAMLCKLDEKLEALRSLYRARESRELEILILSDHGNNHAGPARRVAIRSFLKKAGYRPAKAILNPKDVVLPTAGMESWVEIHNAPAETERLLQLLSHLEGVDVLTGRDPSVTNRFLVMNSEGGRATIEWDRARNSFRYTAQAGDPIDYLPVVEVLRRKHQLGADGFAAADAWMAETMAHRYPLALERIARGHTRAALNPATILISLDNAYIHCGWWVKRGSEVVRFGGTHGGLDDLNSNGILLSSFAPTRDTSANRVAALFEGFPGLRDFHSEENGAEWVSAKAQALTTVPRTPLDRGCEMFSNHDLLLRVWTPSFARLSAAAPVDVTVRKARQFLPAQIRRGDPQPVDSSERRLTLQQPLAIPGNSPCERVYALPAGLGLEPKGDYLISGRLRDEKNGAGIFTFAFRTDSRGLPVMY